MTTTFAIDFWGAATVSAYRIPRHRRNHSTLESAADEARRVLGRLSEMGVRGAHPAIISWADEDGETQDRTIA